jgi:hypothetical protein
MALRRVLADDAKTSAVRDRVRGFKQHGSAAPARAGKPGVRQGGLCPLSRAAADVSRNTTLGSSFVADLRCSMSFAVIRML